MIYVILSSIDPVVSTYTKLLEHHGIAYVVVHPEESHTLIPDGCIPIVVSIDRKTLEQISLILHQKGIHIYDVLIKENLLSECSVDWFTDRTSPIYYRVEHKALCAYLEVQIADHCNLKCKGCMHFSNLVDHSVFFSMDSFEKDLLYMKKSLEVLKFRIMGGEPLLNPNFENYVRIVRKMFPKSKLSIVTNGLLLDRVPMEKLQVLADCQCEIDISVYPIIQNKLQTIVTILEFIQLRYRLIGDSQNFSVSFMKQLSLNPNYTRRNHKRCSCNFWSEHRLSRCCFPATIPYFNECFGNIFDVKPTDFFEINSDFDGFSFLLFLQQEIEFCKYCVSKDRMIDWIPFVNSQKAKESDYVIV